MCDRGHVMCNRTSNSLQPSAWSLTRVISPRQCYNPSPSVLYWSFHLLVNLSFTLWPGRCDHDLVHPGACRERAICWEAAAACLVVPHCWVMTPCPCMLRRWLSGLQTRWVCVSHMPMLKFEVLGTCISSAQAGSYGDRG
jgi:hypothetical protein